MARARPRSRPSRKIVKSGPTTACSSLPAAPEMPVKTRAGREETDEEAAQRHLTWFYARHRRSDCSRHPSHAARLRSARRAPRRCGRGRRRHHRPTGSGRAPAARGGWRPTCGPPRPDRRDRRRRRVPRAARAHPPRAPRRRAPAPSTSSSATTTCNVLPKRRERDHVVVEDALRDRCRQLVEVELKFPHAPSSNAGWSSPSQPALVAAALPGVEGRKNGSRPAGTRDAASS